ncbi:MAG: VWA domain-containing protein [Spirochaetia bacterium]|nr:VWA domain-containing protein [Spirochaetia bacterium]
MTRKIHLPLSYLIFLILANSLYSQPFLKIHEVKTQEYPYIGVGVTVSNEAPIENLDESNFSLYENGWKVGFFRIKKTEEEKISKNIVLLIDSSKSLSPVSFKAQIDAAQMLINAMKPLDEVSVISFNDTVQIHCGFTNSHEQLKQCLTNVKQNGKKTVLFDALHRALTLDATGKLERKFIVLFTDGKEEKSVISIKEIKDLINKSNIPVFIICAGKNKHPNELEKISRLTGGEIYNSPDMDTIVKVYKLLGSIKNATYQLQYISQVVSKVNDKGSVPVRLEIRMVHGEIQDQDVVEFNLPVITFLTSLKNAFTDERFKIFIGSSFILILIVLFITYFTSQNFKGRINYKKTGSGESIPVFETIYEKNNALDPIHKKNIKNEENHKPENHDKISDKYFAYIIEKEGPHTGRTSKIKWNIVTIGNGNENSIVINDPTVSYSHAKIVMSGDEFYLHDMISESGVFLNGKKLLRPKPLNDFDEILIGRTKLLFRKASR